MSNSSMKSVLNFAKQQTDDNDAYEQDISMQSKELSSTGISSDFDAEVAAGELDNKNFSELVPNAMQEKMPDLTKCIEPPTVSVTDMTSRELHYDEEARTEVIERRLKCKTTKFFKEMIFLNKHLFRGRTVLEVGCGTGILSLFCAKAGATRVFAVDSSNIVEYARHIVEKNDCAKVVEVIKGPIEQIQLPVGQVDIIISDWMGFSLLFQSHCDDVIYARNKWLKPDGLILPDIAELFFAPMTDTKGRNAGCDWWNSAYGFNMQCIRKVVITEPFFKTVKPAQVLGPQIGVFYLDLNRATKEDLYIRCKFPLQINSYAMMDGIVTYFNVHFSKAHTPTSLRTDPWSPSTRWSQSVFYFNDPVEVKTGDRFYGGIEMKSTKDCCDLNDMQLEIEIFKGDYITLELATEMTWKLKVDD